MEKQNDKIIKALRRFFSGEESEEGERIYNYWFNSFDDSKGYLDKLSQKEQERYKKQLLRSIQGKIDDSPENGRPFSIISSQRKWSKVYRFAAIFLLGAILSYLIVRINDIHEPTENQTVMVERSNSKGQISKLTLPDGSKVWLSAASTLRYPEKFSDEKRIVDLDGEAYFEVMHDPAHPFIVKSGLLATRVLGTSFNIKAYHNDPDKEVTLADGSVEVLVDNGNQKKILSPNQQVKYDRNKGWSEIQKVNASLVRAWTRKELVFMRESFGTIARTFERWYDMEFVFEGEALRDEEFVYHFKELSLRNSLIILNELADFDYSIEGEKVFIRKPEK